MGRGDRSNAGKPWLPARIKQARKQAGLNQSEAARLIGVHANTISRYERGEFPPTTPALHALAATLNTPISWFLDANPCESIDDRPLNSGGSVTHRQLDEKVTASLHGASSVANERPILSRREPVESRVSSRSIGRRPATQAPFEQWIDLVTELHTGFEDRRNHSISWTPLTKPLSQSVVAIVSTAGVHHRDATPFDIANPRGDSSYREVSRVTPSNELAVSHTHYNHVSADQDINCIFPVDRLNELERLGVIGQHAKSAYSMMGFIPDPVALLEETSVQISEKLTENDVDLVIMSAGCMMCHRSMALVQNAIEGSGIATVAMTVEPHVTAGIGSPRSVHARFPAGNVFGEAGKPLQQRTIVTSALETAYTIEAPGTSVELPYRWRRFPIIEDVKLRGTSDGPRHTHAEELNDALDNMVRKAAAYRAFLEYRVAEDRASDEPVSGMPRAFGAQIERVDDLIESLDTVTLDQLRPVLNDVALLELWASGHFV